MSRLLLILAFLPALLFAQSKKERKALEAQQKADQQVISNLKNHTQFLTASKTAEPGSTSSTDAFEYISRQFASLALQPKGTNGFIQPFLVDDGKRMEPATFLKVNEVLLQANKEYFPLSYSAQKKVTGMPAIALRERGVPWFADLKDWLEDGLITEAHKIEDAIKKEVLKVAAKGATALFLYNSGSVADGLAFNKSDKSVALPIPVIYITADGYKKYFNDHSQMLSIELNVAFKESSITGSNVIGYIDNAEASTIVIGAHYNHSPAKDADKLMVTGANDNASGTAMLIELARMLAASKAKSNNYLFIALGGNDNGLTACNYWQDNAALNTPVNYMLNLDMTGSYSDNKNLSVQGYGSSLVWNTVFASISDKKLMLYNDSTSAIAEPQVSFYNKAIPVLSFSAADHGDYAANADEESKINYMGELQIAKFITRLIEATDSKGKIAFAKAEQQSIPVVKAAEQVEAKPIAIAETAPSKTTVSLGIIPDKTGNEAGLRISGVSPQKLAFKIGLLPGDVLTQLGSYKIFNFKSYMQALSNFKTGDKTTLQIKRGNDDKEFAVEF